MYIYMEVSKVTGVPPQLSSSRHSTIFQVSAFFKVSVNFSATWHEGNI